MKLDPVLLEILHSKVQAAAEQMGTTLQRTARTLFVKEAADFASRITEISSPIPGRAGSLSSSIAIAP